MQLKILYKIFEQKKFGLSILCFHSVGGDFNFSLNLAEFKEIIINLQSQFKFITPNEFEFYYQNKLSFKENCILLTFDDGFKDNLYVAEFLSTLRINAIFFINGMLLEQNSKFLETFNKDRNFIFSFNDFLEVKDVQSIKELGHEIGNHFYSHVILDDINLFSEVYSSNKIFTKFNLSTRFYALPYGRIELYKLNQINKLIDLGYLIFSMDPRNVSVFNFKQRSIPRIGIGVPDVFKGLYLSKIRGSHRFRSFFKGSFK